MLSDKRIMEEIYRGNIIIEPFDERHLGTNSYDCRLGEWYFRGDPVAKIVRVDEPEDVLSYWGPPLLSGDGTITVNPGMTILAHTYEIMGTRNGVVAKMYCRSTIARCGLSVCRCAGVGDVGYIDHWTMEISNHTRSFIELRVGMRVCQFTFDHVGETLKQYQGKYGCTSWSPLDMLPKPHRDWDYESYCRGQV